MERTDKPMIASCRIALTLLVVFALHLDRTVGQEIQWRDAASLTVEGKGWAATAGPFDRLPDSAQSKVSPGVWGLSKHSAGICIRFVTDATHVSIRWSLTGESLAMPHMPATGVSGVDLYTRGVDHSWQFVGNGRPGAKEGNLAVFELPNKTTAPHECLLYLPLYNGTKSLEIGVPQGASLEPAPLRPEDHRKPIVVYGTSIAQGGCASRPGMAWTAILGRLLDRPVINLGFSGSGTMEPPVAEPLAELDPAAYVIDCTWNMGVSQEVYMDRIGQLVRTIRKTHSSTPMIFVGQSHMRPEAHPTDLSKQQEAAVLAMQKEAFEGLILVSGADLIGDDGEGTVDGVHPNDLGMDRHARALFPIVSKV
ncbi:MAG: SGNH/GDSL hydrolase family protein, partial [Solirubrobacterales bacterium]